MNLCIRLWNSANKSSFLWTTRGRVGFGIALPNLTWYDACTSEMTGELRGSRHNCTMDESSEADGAEDANVARDTDTDGRSSRFGRRPGDSRGKCSESRALGTPVPSHRGFVRSSAFLRLWLERWGRSGSGGNARPQRSWHDFSFCEDSLWFVRVGCGLRESVVLA